MPDSRTWFYWLHWNSGGKHGPIYRTDANGPLARVYQKWDGATWATVPFPNFVSNEIYEGSGDVTPASTTDVAAIDPKALL